jgi:site-specific DNA-methyltransferase (adenine-specific)
MAENILYYGDNLYWLRRMPPETVDLIYLDPPFNSNRSYNVLFKDERGSESEAQITAFEDTWHWNPATERAYAEVVERAPSNVVRLVAAFREAIGANQMMAYLVMMTVRLVELHRVLKPTGSLYLHCDPTASHYLKVILDAIFGAEQFRNEIVWKRTTAHNDPQRYGANIDVLLFYTKGSTWTWNELHIPHDSEYLGRFRHQDRDGRLWTDDNLTAKGLSGGGYEYEYKGIRSLWRCPEETMKRLDAEGRLHFTKAGGIRLKRYLDETPGASLQALWADIPPINSQARERMGYPTQKPLALLERIISASSSAGDVVLDPFCGCGTAIAAAQKLGRRWVGIDITHLSIALLKYRLERYQGVQFRVEGEPTDLAGARKLALDDRYQFQFWACSLVRDKPLGGQVGSRTGKRGSDRGVDGIIDFEDDAARTPKKAIVQVKSGHVKSGDVRDLVGTMQREKAEIGVFLTLELPSREMLTEAASAGLYSSPWGKHARVQIFTIEELLDKRHPRRVDMPPQTTFAAGPPLEQAPDVGQSTLFGGLAAEDEEAEEEEDV